MGGFARVGIQNGLEPVGQLEIAERVCEGRIQVLEAIVVAIDQPAIGYTTATCAASGSFSEVPSNAAGVWLSMPFRRVPKIGS